MQEQVKIVGWLHIILNGIVLVVALGVFFIFVVMGGALAATGGSDAHAAMGIMAIIGVVLLVVFSVAAIPGFIAGFGVLNYAQWGRILCMIVSVLHLFNFPVGTMVGGYSLYVLTNAETTALFDRRRY